MKVLLISTNKEIFPLPVAPIGITCLAATLRKEGYIVKTLDLCFLKHIKKKLAGCIKSFNPDIIGISVRNLDNSTFIGAKSYLQDTKGIVDYIKRNSKALIVVGGTGFSSCPSPMLKYLGLCYGIIGEGEEPFLKLVQCVEKKCDIGLIPGIVYSKGEKIVINKKPDFSHLDNLPKPAWDLIMCDKYMRYGGYGAIQTKRGCKFDCIYCSYPVLEGDSYRYRSPQAIVDGMQEMKEKGGIRYFYFVDSVFSFPERHARMVCEEIIRRNLNIGWLAMTNPRSINVKLVELMKQSGCIGVEVGIDSGSKDMLERLQKRFTKEDIAHTARLYTQAKIPFSFYLLLGGPGESPDTIQETVNFLKEIDQPNQVLLNFGIRVYAGTQLETIARAEGILKKDEDLLAPKHYLSKELGISFLEKLDEYCSTQYHWSNATDWNSPTTILLQKMGQRFQIRPLWKNAYIMGLTRKLKRFCLR
ncbi:MAG: B12-binding domain-containing radical SAM protein [Candidatus Scalinduaceae bacterium]